MNDLDLFFSTPEKKNKKTECHCYGIELGTTNSTIAEIVWQPGGKPSCRILEIDQATQLGQYTSPLIPSVVAILPDDQVKIRFARFFKEIGRADELGSGVRNLFKYAGIIPRERLLN